MSCPVIAQRLLARDNGKTSMKALLSTCALVATLLTSAVGAALPTAIGDRAAGIDSGFLDVSSDPSSAKILIDDVDVGQATPQHHLAVNAGHHRLTLVTSNGAHKLTVGFSVEAGQTKKLTLYLSK
jgi:hypothetical protein